MNRDKGSHANGQGLMKSLMHDVAFLMTVEIFNIFSCVLRDDEHRDAFWEIYERVREGLLSYETKADRRMARLHPGRN